MNFANVTIPPNGVFNFGVLPSATPVGAGEPSIDFSQWFLQLLAGDSDAMAELPPQGVEVPAVVAADLAANQEIMPEKQLPANSNQPLVSLGEAHSNVEQVLPKPVAHDQSSFDLNTKTLALLATLPGTKSTANSETAAKPSLPVEQSAHFENVPASPPGKPIPEPLAELGRSNQVPLPQTPITDIDHPVNNKTTLALRQETPQRTPVIPPTEAEGLTADGTAETTGLREEAARSTRPQAAETVPNQPTPMHQFVARPSVAEKVRTFMEAEQESTSPAAAQTSSQQSGKVISSKAFTRQEAPTNQQPAELVNLPRNKPVTVETTPVPERAAVTEAQHTTGPMARGNESPPPVLRAPSLTVEKLVVGSSPTTTVQQAAKSVSKETMRKTEAARPHVTRPIISEAKKTETPTPDQTRVDTKVTQPQNTNTQPKPAFTPVMNESAPKPNPIDVRPAEKAIKSPEVATTKETPVQVTQTAEVKQSTLPTEKPAEAGRVQFVIENDIPSPPLKERAVLQIRLVPDSLGPMKMHLQTVDNQLTARVVVQSDAARVMVENNFGDLQRSLADAGLVIEKFEIAVAQAAEHMRPDPDANPHRRRAQYRFKTNRRYKAIAGIETGNQSVSHAAQMPAAFSAGSLNLVA